MLTSISEYTCEILNSNYPQSNFLDVNKFLRFLKKRGIRLTKNELEYYDKKEIMRPVLRLHRPLANDGPMKYSMVDVSISGLKEYYKAGLAKLPADGDFQPWDNYFDNGEEKVIQFYHPFQFVLVRISVMNNNIHLRPWNLEVVDSSNWKNFVERLKNESSMLIEGSFKRSKEATRKLGLLMLLDQAYGPFVKNMKLKHDVSEVEDWNKWRKNEFSPQRILESLGMTIEDVKGFYVYLSNMGYDFDPLANWFSLLQLMKRSALARLEGTALLSQSYYTLARMVSKFIYELSGEKTLDPDDSSEGSEGEWKKEVYGNPFDYGNRKIRNNILDNYLATRQFRLILVVEGYTEESIINELLEVLRIVPDRAGLIIHNLEGQQNIKMNLRTVYYLASKDFIDVFTILDNDQDANEIIAMYNIDTERYHKWKKDFEYDNFGVDAIVNYVNLKLRNKGLEGIQKKEVEHELSTTDKTLMNIINNQIMRINRTKYKISKNTMCKTLTYDRISEIDANLRVGKEWEPFLPIEHVLKKVFRIFPELSFASPIE
jgi:hypothetical protein